MIKRLPFQHPLRKLLAAAVIAIAAGVIAIGMHRLTGVKIAMDRVDDLLYDTMFRLRPPESRVGGDVVIITVDDNSIEDLKKQHMYWPYRRDWWGKTVELLQQCGAKVVAYDILFEEPSPFDVEDGDDSLFVESLNRVHVPTVMAVVAQPLEKRGAAGPGGPFALATTRPVLGATNLTDRTNREYITSAYGLPSLAVRAATAAGAPARSWAAEPFRLHYYGPSQDEHGPMTYRYVSAYSVFAAAQKLFRHKPLKDCGIDPALFKDKIVLIGYTAASLYDLKSAPVALLYPGMEVHATAIDNLLHDQYVRVAGVLASLTAILAVGFLTAFGAILLYGQRYKLLVAAGSVALLIGLSFLAFDGREIRWLPLASPLLAWLLATIGGLSWSHYTEGRHRKQLVRAFAQIMSPEMVAEIERDPRQLDPGGERRDMTVMFTDIAGFTTLTEQLENHVLLEVVNCYFEHVTPLIIAGKGTFDKYIGDATMSFWNAPIGQENHAAMACRVALQVAEAEKQIQSELQNIVRKHLAIAQSAPEDAGAAVLDAVSKLHTRVGINSGTMVVGFTGSGQRLNYGILGDAVNLGSRLEGANKFYGSQILIAESTAEAARSQFLLRKLDVLQVKGKRKSLAVYELLAEGSGTEQQQVSIELYEAAFHAHQKQDWDSGELKLTELLSQFPNDAPARALKKRIAGYRAKPPAADWDGVFVAEEK